MEKVLNSIKTAAQLQALSPAEIKVVLEQLRDFHAQAYDWPANLDIEQVLKATETRGYLLRTRIRAAVELLDQLYQYGQAGDIRINELGEPQYPGKLRRYSKKIIPALTDELNNQGAFLRGLFTEAVGPQELSPGCFQATGVIGMD